MKQTEQNQFRDLTRPEISRLLKEHTVRILATIENKMKEKDISRTELGFRISMDKQNVSRIFANKYQRNGLTTNVLIRMASAMDLQLVDLVK